MADAVWRVTGEPLVAGSPGGPLSGLRVAVKDLFAVAGQPIGGGNPQWLAGAPVEKEHAWAVQALLDAGADLAGIARTDELAFSLAGTNVHYGTPVNPAAPGRITGGSTSGPAAAVALGQADLGLGTDTAGSIRVPGSYCGLYGLRTTHGAVPVTGVLPLARSFDTVGWLARDASVLARAGQVLLPAADPEPIDGWLIDDELTALAAPEIQDSFTAACTPLRPGRVSGLLHEDWFTAFRTVQTYEAWQQHGGWIQAHPGALGPGVAARFAAGSRVTEAEHQAARKVVAQARAALRQTIRPGTALLLPTSTTTAPPADLDDQAKDALRAATLRLTSLASLAGLPALTMPLPSGAGLPAGLCMIGAPGSDHALLTHAAAHSGGPV